MSSRNDHRSIWALLPILVILLMLLLAPLLADEASPVSTPERSAAGP
ncbi:MAG: hypothetical protein JNK40_10445 [Chromatiales bacterium]|nr:hypothetical protein [Chromatiales bacterium]